MVIFLETGNFNEVIYHIDLAQYGMHRVASSFLYYDGKSCILMDSGTSDDVYGIIRKIRKFKIPYDHVKGIILTHYHFDHGGGATKMWAKMSKKNPDFKIFVSKITHDKLQNAEEHLMAAKTTFGDNVGLMNPAPEDAYTLIDYNQPLPFDLNDDYSIKLISTPGHSPDHGCPVVEKSSKTKFIFAGEAAGTLFHGSKLVSLPTSMPSNFQFDKYIDSMKKIIALKPESIGFCHFGAITQQDESMTFLNEHLKYIQDFRNKIIELFRTNSNTRYIIENMGADLWDDRVDPYYFKSPVSSEFFNNLKLALVYGMMIDLGFRNSKYEKREV